MTRKNKPWRSALPLLALLFVPTVVQAQTARLSGELKRLFDVAEQHNASLQTLEAAFSTEQAGIETARMAKLPDITGSASFSYLGNGRTWNRSFGDSQSAPMPHYGNNFSLAARQVLYGGGTIRSNIELAQKRTELANLSLQEGKQRVRFALVGLFLQLHALRNQENVYTQNASLAASLIEQMTKRREQGISLRNDITRYELQRQQMLLGETTMANEQNIVRKQLLTALGTDSLATALLPEDAFDENALALQSEADWQQLALCKHLGLQKTDLGVSIKQTEEKLARAARRPTVSALAESHLDGPITIEVPPIDRNFHYWFVGVNISYNFSSLYKAKRNIKQAGLATASAQTSLSEQQQAVADEVHAAYVNLSTARAALATSKKSVQLAVENYEVVSKRYLSGLALVTDLTDAANMKLEAELSLADARINLFYTYYKLRYAANAL